MKDTNWKDIAELIGIVAIVASLVFVGMQMQQDRVHARAELGADSFSNLASLSLELTSGEFAPVFAKAIEQPGELTTAEQLQVNAYLEAYTYLILRDCYLMEREVFIECEIIVREYGPRFFGNHYAQSWWKLQNAGDLEFMPDWVDAAITGIDPESNARLLNVLREKQ
jgi:hypothetical protein